MKRPESESNRIVTFARHAIALPFAVTRTIYRRIAALFGSVRSPKQRRAEDQRRQSRVRRSLRGLTPDHVPKPAKPA